MWATANQTLINGKKVPGLLDIKGGGIDPQQRQAMVQAMQQLGLPAGWSPNLSCETATQVSVQEQLRKAKMEGCQVDVTEQRLDSLKFKLACTPKAGANELGAGALQGTGEVTGIGSSEVKMGYRAQTTVQGKPWRFDSESVSKWVGADCKRPPAGVDPAWVGMQAL